MKPHGLTVYNSTLNAPAKLACGVHNPAGPGTIPSRKRG